MGQLGRSRFWLFAAIAVGTSFAVLDSLAQSYPVKPIHMVAGQAPGGSTDVTARIVAQKLSEHLGGPVVVENRTGVAGSIAAEKVAASPADGYTLLVLVFAAAVVGSGAGPARNWAAI